MDSTRLVYTTWPDSESARAAAGTVLEEGLCACVNLLPGMTSLYRWQGRMESAAECVALFKTTSDRSAALGARLAALHPYEVPAILALPVDTAASDAGFLDWIDEQTRPT
ncbi:divalent-cation tolerance protein CutA [Maricaulis sp.]|uniref:divalent-cation tolerance protein CutA n=1 Tax=Maricaulis sp. TaxID=1486257 RepID=UPI002B279E71|nr:divalent-cation tolerance protein CutA [Maricaulis sp.]